MASAGALALLGSLPDLAPPDSDPADGDTSFEQQLAQWSFGTFLAIDLGVDPGTFTCTEPESMDSHESVTCFALTGDDRVVVARSSISGGSGVFDFTVIDDYLASDVPLGSVPVDIATTTSPTTSPQPTTTYPREDVTQANVAVLLQGDSINEIAQNEIASMINASDGSVIAVNAWRWDAASGRFTVDFTLNPVSGIEPDVAAWIAATNLSVHWGLGQAFREPAATIRPILLVIVDGHRYESDWDLMTQVADLTIGQDDWLAAARVA